MRLALLLLLVIAGGVSGEIKIAILMQGSDFINVTIVPTFDVNQFDLGDVFISPCRAGTYNEARDSYCKDCAICTDFQYQSVDCVATHNRVCLNCSICTDREQEMCACRQLSAECVTGNRVCLPLPPTTANITFDLTVSMQLSPLKERFLQEGLRTGFVLFLSEYLQHNPDDIVLLSLTKRLPRVYFATFLVNNMYSLFTKSQVSRIDQPIVQAGLTSTFGVQSNTFSTAQQRRRRLLQQQGTTIDLQSGNVESKCITKQTDACSRFFVLVISPDNQCNTRCDPLPCPPGYSGSLGFCYICPNATYKPLEGNETCTPCPPGSSSDEGSVNATQCWVPTTPAPTTTPGPTTSGGPPTTTRISSTAPVQTPAVPGATSAGGQPVSSSSATAATARATPAPTTTTWSQQTPQPTTSITTTTAAPPTGGGGGWGLTLFNLTVINNYLFTAPPEWNTGRAGVVQYITINEARDQYASTMVSVLMVAGLLAIGAIGMRLLGAHNPPGYTRIPAEKKKEIPLPIHLPPPVHHDEPPPDKSNVFHFPPFPKLEQRRHSRGKATD